MARREEPLPPRESTPDLPPVLTAVNGLGRAGAVMGARVEGLHGDVDASHGELAETLWEAPTLDRLDLTGATLADTRWTEPRIGALLARDGRWRNVEISGGRIGTADFLRAELDGVVLRDLRIDYLGLPAARIGHVRFVGCRFGTLDLPEAQMHRVVFEDCRADEVDTRGLRAAHLDLRGLEALSFTDPASLRAATLSPRQAETHGPAFATALGIRLAD